MNNLKNKVISEFKFYWNYMMKCRNENDEPGVYQAFIRLDVYIGLLKYFYKQLNTMMLWKIAFNFYLGKQK